MRLAIFFILTSVLSALAACSETPTTGTQGYGATGADEAPSEIDEIASSNVYRDANGQVKSVKGLKVNANLVQDAESEKSQDQAEIANQENLKNTIINDDKLFEYNEPDDTTAEFSEPKMVSASYLALSDVGSNLCDNSGVFSETEPRISTVIDYVKECGDYRMYFCIRLSLKDSSANGGLSSSKGKRSAFIESPSIPVNLPCPESIFKEISINIEDNKVSTSRSSVSLGFTARPLISKMFVTNSSDCKTGGIWENFNTKKFAWILSPDKEKMTAEVYVKFKDLLFGYESKCIKDTIDITANTAITDHSDSDGSTNTSDSTNTTADATDNTVQDSGSDVDTTPPTALSLSIEAGASYTTNSAVSLSLAATDASQMYITNIAGCGTGGTWEPYTTSKASWTLEQSNATAAVYTKFKDDAGNESSCINDSIIHDNTAPSFTTFTISSGASYTTSTTVSLSFAASAADASEMYLTNTAGCTSGGTWEAYATGQSPWTLTQTNGTATVYGKVKDNAGNISACSSDTIIHDSVAPSTPASVSSSSPSASQVSLSWASSTDSGSGIAAYEIALGTTSAGTEVKDWTNVGNVTSSTLTGLSLSSSSSYYPSVRAVDTAGNTGSIKTGSSFSPTASVVEISSGSSYNCARFDTGAVKCWGHNESGALGQNNINSIGDASGEMASLAAIAFKNSRTMSRLANTPGSGMCSISSTNELFCWGPNLDGRLGLGNTTTIGTTTDSMSSLNPVNLGTGRTATQVSVSGYTTGDGNTCVVLDNGSAKCWGYNDFGQLGQGASFPTYGDNSGETPAALSAINFGSRTVTKIQITTKFACALLDDATLKCWGRNSSGQLGLGHTTSSNAPGLAIDFGGSLTVTDFALSEPAVGCAILSNGTVKCWGYDGTYGTLGQNMANTIIGDSSAEIANLTPVNLGAGNTATQITAGTSTVCVVLAGTDAGKAKCWGRNSEGQLGQGNTTNYGSNTASYGMANLNPINLGTGRTVLQISAGAVSNCALLDNRAVKCWGYADRGQLGSNTGNTSNNIGDAANEMGDNLPAVSL